MEELTLRNYRVAPGTWDEDSRSFEAILATESPAYVYDPRRRRVVREVLLMDGVAWPENEQIPLLDSHDSRSIRSQLGSVRNLRVEDGKFVGRIFISAVEDRAATKVREGHITDNSIGYIVHEAEMIEPGETREIMGRRFSADSDALQVSTRWSVHENSILPIGADQLAKIREAAMAENSAEPPAAEEIEEPSVDVQDPATETLTEETDTVREELDLATRRAEIEARTPRGYEHVAELAIIEGWDWDKTREALLAERAERMKPVGTPEPVDQAVDSDAELDLGKDEFLSLF